jgi:hypothetical protein
MQQARAQLVPLPRRGLVKQPLAPALQEHASEQLE